MHALNMEPSDDKAVAVSKITATDVTKVYSTKKSQFVALDRVSFHVDAHEFVSFVGPSGCGKSSLIDGSLRD